MCKTFANKLKLSCLKIPNTEFDYNLNVTLYKVKPNQVKFDFSDKSCIIKVNRFWIQ